VLGALHGVNPSSLRADGMIFDSYVGNPLINTLPLEDVSVPALVISAVDDPMALHASAVTLAQRIPGARLMAVADGGHLMLGHTAEVRQAITDFLRQDAAVR
jgi:pimeloyl-ACP methyl ester carboxylesterase